MPEPTFRDILHTVSGRRDLSQEQAYWVFSQIMDGKLSEVQTAGLLMAMATKGHTTAEIAGAAQAMRERSVKIDPRGGDLLDTCGTGGTGLATFNVSTTCAFVAAGAGVRVAKHGNYTHTRPSGSANVLQALGVNIEASPEAVARCIDEAGVGFCFAVRCHPAMKFAAPVRKQLPVRTIFNVLGPLTNPAGARRQVLGVFAAELTEPLAEVLGRLGSARAWVLSAEDGLDELSLAAPTRVSELREGKVHTRTVRPEDFGLDRADLDAIATDSPEASARTVRAVLDGQPGPARDIVLLNTAAALIVADKADDPYAAVRLAAESIDTGRAAEALRKLVAISNA